MSEYVIDRSIIQKMNNTMAHRGPDDESFYSNNINGSAPFIRLAHRRLSIIDLSSAGKQPMPNEDKTIWLVFNGEIYNYLSLREKLQDKGHNFRSSTDSEVLIHLYEEYGKHCLSFLNGMFAFGIWDENKKTLFLARDRAGKKPLLYYCKDNLLIFASEFAALLSGGLIKKEVNMEGINDYFSLGYIPAPKSGYKDIFKLPPAHYLIYKNGKTEVKRYWTLNYSKKISVSFNDACERVMELLTDAVKIRMLSDVPLGAFLSGGIDSSVVVSLMSKLSRKKIKTFSIAFEESDYNEAEYARAVSEKFNTDHYEFTVKADALEVLPLLIERYGEPYADSSAIPAYYVAKLTRQYVTAALNGDGGDEVFAGYDRYRAMKLSEYVPEFLRNNILPYLMDIMPVAKYNKGRWANILKFLGGCRMNLSPRYHFWMSILNEDAKKEILSDDFTKKLHHLNTSNLMQGFLVNQNGNCDLEIIDKLLMVDTSMYLPYDLLVKVDIASMANSLEARSPFLDYRLMEYAASLPSDYKLKWLTTKYLLKKTFKGILPAPNIYRRKMGFAVPVGIWFRNELKNYIRDVLFSPASLKRGYFKPGALTRMVNDHISGVEDNSYPIWALLGLELWHRRFIDGGGFP